jgi:hypothetical protein
MRFDPLTRLGASANRNTGSEHGIAYRHFLIEDAMRSSQNRKRRTRKSLAMSFGVVRGSPVRYRHRL